MNVFLQNYSAARSPTRGSSPEVYLHAELMIRGSMIMVADATDKWTPSANSLFIWVENADVTYQKAIENGAESIMDLANFETRRISGVKDAFNNTWWITSVLK
jgi:PhnB protein